MKELMFKEMERLREYFPYRKISGVLLDSGEFKVFANSTFAQANNFAKKNSGQIYRFEVQS